MSVAAAAATVMTAAAVLGAGRFPGRARSGEGGELLGNFLGAAMRTLRPLPVGGADEDFAVVGALVTMKFVNRHGGKIVGGRQMFKPRRSERPSPTVSTRIPKLTAENAKNAKPDRESIVARPPATAEGGPAAIAWVRKRQRRGIFVENRTNKNPSSVRSDIGICRSYGAEIILGRTVLQRCRP